MQNIINLDQKLEFAVVLSWSTFRFSLLNTCVYESRSGKNFQVVNRYSVYQKTVVDRVCFKGYGTGIVLMLC